MGETRGDHKGLTAEVVRSRRRGYISVVEDVCDLVHAAVARRLCSVYGVGVTACWECGPSEMPCKDI